jgi:hypothetical protein
MNVDRCWSPKSGARQIDVIGLDPGCRSLSHVGERKSGIPDRVRDDDTRMANVAFKQAIGPATGSYRSRSTHRTGLPPVIPSR